MWKIHTFKLEGKALDHTTVLNNEERRSIGDQGKWSIVTVGEVVAVQYRSASGQVTAFPVHIAPNGGLWAGNGITVVSQGATAR